MPVPGQPVSTRRNVVMRTKLVIAAATLALVAGGATAKEIYKWTDAEGNVHYEDRPVGEQAQQVAIASKPTDPARVAAQAQARRDAQAKRAEEAAAAAASGPSPEELAAKAEERTKKCTQYRQTLQKFVVSRRLYREDENGERIYLDDKEAQAARDKVEAQVEEYCS
jgi:hypothetical protein